jgi:hypothetical protein
MTEKRQNSQGYILSAFYNILQRNFGILLILVCSFKLWWNFWPDLSRSKSHLKGERSIAWPLRPDYFIFEQLWYYFFNCVYPNPPCQFSPWKETGAFEENPRHWAALTHYLKVSFHNHESVTRIEPTNSNMQGVFSDHCANEAHAPQEPHDIRWTVDAHDNMHDKWCELIFEAVLVLRRN